MKRPPREVAFQMGGQTTTPFWGHREENRETWEKKPNQCTPPGQKVSLKPKKAATRKGRPKEGKKPAPPNHKKKKKKKRGPPCAPKQDRPGNFGNVGTEGAGPREGKTPRDQKKKKRRRVSQPFEKVRPRN